MACPVKMLILFVLNALFSIYGTVNANKTNPYHVEIEPHWEWETPLHVDENQVQTVHFSVKSGSSGDKRMILPVSSHPDIFSVTTDTNNSMVEVGEERNMTMKVKGLFLGRAFLKIFTNTTDVKVPEKYDAAYSSEISVNDDDWYELGEQYDVTVSRKAGALSHSFTGMVIILVCLANVAMGCKTELSVVKEVLRKPIGPLTGMFSQFVLMPLIAMAIIFMLKFDAVYAIGFFAMACSPGGAASNMYTYLLEGDVSLSVTMTLCSTLLSFGMIPLWLFTVGAKVLYKTDIQIPFMNIFTSLAGLLIPVAIGMLIQWKRPNWAKYIVKGIRPLMVIFFILVFSVGVYANLYIFTLMRNKPEILLAGALIPYIGFIFGGLVAVLSRQSWKRIRTIAIETGIQNTGISIVLLKVSLPPPDNDISIVGSIAAAIFTPIPMLIAIAVFEVRKRCFTKREEMYLNDHEGGSDLESSTEDKQMKMCNGGGNYIGLTENNNLHGSL